MRIIKAEEWPDVSASLPPIELLLNPLIPAYGKTLLHGPPGSGKSAMMWGVGNAVIQGSSYLGLTTHKAKVLLISTDMSIYELKHRWNDAFIPLFDILCINGFDCTKQKFNQSALYTVVQRYVHENQIGLVMIDALGGIHSGRSARDDEVADAVDHALTEWLPETGLLLLGHDRKLRHNKDGAAIEPGSEDFLGSQKWRANMTSQVHMWPIGEYISKVQHDKSQVSARLPEAIKLYIDIHGRAELFDEHRAQKVSTQYNDGIKLLSLENQPAGAQIEALAKHYGKSERTVKRWKQLAGLSREYERAKD